MLFNSLVFLAFLPVALIGALTLRGNAWRGWVLVASYVFYGYWDPRFLILIAGSTVLDYVCASRIAASDSAPARKRWLLLSLVVNLGVLAYFKYANFFLDSLDTVLARFGSSTAATRLDIVLPVGISFYTFQTLSYTIDVYRGDTKPAKSLLSFATYVAFFPQLVAGPIERSSRLLPQIEEGRVRPTALQLDEALWLIAVGFAKKVFIADNLAPIVSQVFKQEHPGGLTVMVGTVAFAFQIYGDFSGYSDIARGVSKLMGVDLMLNFHSPYLASGPADFWRRWHISLSTWLRDYLYIPLGGNRGGTVRMYRNLSITMLLGGLWHGAAWTFVIWGAYQGVLLIAERLVYGKPPPHPARFRLSPLTLFRTAVTFVFVCYGWLIFRAQDVHQLWALTRGLVAHPLSTAGLTKPWLLALLVFGGSAMLIQAAEEGAPERPLRSIRPVWRGLILAVLTYAVLILGAPGDSQFIYFQF
ncbi:MAG: MBOAT family protein [Polyangiaceae bacterium]